MASACQAVDADEAYETIEFRQQTTAIYTSLFAKRQQQQIKAKAQNTQMTEDQHFYQRHNL